MLMIKVNGQGRSWCYFAIYAIIDEVKGDRIRVGVSAILLLILCYFAIIDEVKGDRIRVGIGAILLL